MSAARPLLLAGQVLVLALIAVSVQPLPADASNGASPITPSAKAAGRGGAEIAVGDDPFTIVSNPAGMSNIFGYSFALSTQIRFSRTTFNNAFNDDEVDSDFPTIVPGFAFVYDFGVPEVIDQEAVEYGGVAGTTIDDVPWSEYEEDNGLDLGVALSLIVGSSGEARYASPVFPEGESERDELKVLGLHLAGSYRVSSRISFGAAVTPMYASLDTNGLSNSAKGATNGLVRNFNGTQLDQNDPLFLVNGQPITWSGVFAVAGADDSFASSRVDVDDATGFGVSGTLGVLVNVTDWLSVGLSYRTPGFFTPLEGDATVDSTRSVGQSSGLLNQIEANFLDNHLPNDGRFLSGDYDFELENFRTPQILGVGMALRPHERLLLALDVKWINWSDAFDELEIELSNGQNADLNEITSNGGGTIDTKEFFNWDDQVVVAVGAALAVTDWLTLRVGYNYGKSPVPDDTLTPFAAPTIEHHLTFGVGLRFGAVFFDLGYVHGFAKSSTIKNSIVSAEFNDTRQKADQDSFFIGFGVEY